METAVLALKQSEWTPLGPYSMLPCTQPYKWQNLTGGSVRMVEIQLPPKVVPKEKRKKKKIGVLR